jgi:hypothetical protein
MMSDTKPAELREGEVVLTYRQSGRLHRETLPPGAHPESTQARVALVVELLEVIDTPGSDRLSSGELDELGDYPVATEAEVTAALTEAARDRLRIVRESLTTSDAGKLLGVDSSRIRQRLEDGSIWGFKPDGSWRVPAWQFEGGELVPGIAQVNRALRKDLDPRSVEGFLTSPNVDLVVGETKVGPLEWLRAGNAPAAVALIASSL